jgi:hypothetical protein
MERHGTSNVGGQAQHCIIGGLSKLSQICIWAWALQTAWIFTVGGKPVWTIFLYGSQKAFKPTIQHSHLNSLVENWSNYNTPFT